MIAQRSLPRLLAAAMILSGLALAADPETDLANYPKTEKLVKQAVDCMTGDKLNEARKKLDLCLKTIPDHYTAHFLLAQIAYQERDFEQAMLHIDKAIASLGDLDSFFKNQTFEQKQRIDQIKMGLQRTITEFGTGNCMQSVANAASRSLQQIETSENAQLTERNPFAVPAGFYFVRGNCLLRLKRDPEALKQYELAVAADPTHANAWNNLIGLDLAHKHNDQAQEALKKAESYGVPINPKLKQEVQAAKVLVP